MANKPKTCEAGCGERRNGENICPAHRQYHGVRKPTSTCERCWQIYFGISDTCINSGCVGEDEAHTYMLGEDPFTWEPC